MRLYICCMKTITSRDSLPERIMVRSQNELTDLRQSFHQCELDLLFYTLHIFRDGEKEYHFSVSEIENISGKQWNSADVQRYSRTLISRPVSVVDEPGRKWGHYNLFEKVEYENGRMTVRLTDFALPLFANVKSNFTQFELQGALALNSKYSKRLYWMLSRWKKQGGKDYPLTELRQLLGLEDDSRRKGKYVANGEFTRIVRRAVQEINDITDIDVECRWHKCSRSIVSVSFVITEAAAGDASFREPKGKTQLRAAVRRINFLCDGLLGRVDEMWDRGMDADRFMSMYDRMVTEARKDGSMPDSPLRYMVGMLTAEGYLSSPAEAAMKRLGIRGGTEKKAFLKSRALFVEALRRSIAAGLPLSDFSDLASKYGVTEQELSE